MSVINPESRKHVHYALYSIVILAVMIVHGDRPLDSPASKLTVVLMALLIFGESLARIWRSRRP